MSEIVKLTGLCSDTTEDDGELCVSVFHINAGHLTRGRTVATHIYGAQEETSCKFKGLY